MPNLLALISFESSLIKHKRLSTMFAIVSSSAPCFTKSVNVSISLSADQAWVKFKKLCSKSLNLTK